MRSYTAIVTVLLCSLAPAMASADRKDFELSLEAAGGLPVIGYLAPPDDPDNVARYGAAGWISLDTGLSPSWSLEILAGGGYIFETSENQPDEGNAVAQGTIGPKIRFLDSKQLWISGHVGAYLFDGLQFGGDVGVGYDFRIGSEWKLGPFARYQLTMAGDEDPRFPNDHKPDGAIWVGLGLRHTTLYDTDADDDGIDDENDECVDAAEDLDGFEDQDGCPDLDNDGDGLPDAQDKCPGEAEDMDGFQDQDGCLDADNDGDLKLDAEDQCPLEAEDVDGFEDEDGCPEADNDGDGFADAEDKCPMDAEDMDGFQDEDGCPEADNDLDGVPDAEDECPKEPGTPEEKGCPKAVRLDEETGEIRILQRIEFALGKAALKPSAEPILQEVSGVLKANPNVEHVRIEGHSDDRGSDKFNLKLSTARAASVRDWLVAHEVAADRLEAFGCGELHPAESNATKAGRDKNRRVEFNILKEGAEPEYSDCQSAAAPKAEPAPAAPKKAAAEAKPKAEAKKAAAAEAKPKVEAKKAAAEAKPKAEAKKAAAAEAKPKTEAKKAAAEAKPKAE